MRGLGICFIVAVTAHASLGVNNKLYVKFTPKDTDPNHTQGFYELPRSLKSTNDGDWQVVEDKLDKEGVAIVCPHNDYRVCLIVDKKKSVAGLQLSIAAADMKKTNAPVKPSHEKKTVLGTEVYASTIHFVGDDVLKAGGRDMTDNTPTAPNGVLVKTASGLRSIPNTEQEMAGTKYVKQQCFPGMGRHYFYEVSKNGDCATLDVFFGLYNEQSHDLVGLGYFSLGNATVQDQGRPWFEHLAGSAVKYIAPDSPDCLPEHVNQHGTHSLHIYTTNEPWNLKC